LKLFTQLPNDSLRDITATRVVYLKDRNLFMLKQDLSLRNPLRLLGSKTEGILPEGGFGAVLARAGVGKTALTVQIAMNSLLNNQNVLHLSLNDPVEKVTLWYKEVFTLLADQYNVSQIDQLWEAILPHRFIMTFRVDRFTVPRLEERLEDLSAQKIFIPNMIILDGMPFDENVRSHLFEIQALAQRLKVHVWFTVQTHRHEEPEPNGMPPQLKDLSELFDVVIQLCPQGDEIQIVALKGNNAETKETPLRLDPSTMLIHT
jgi:hypothetical protein